MINNFFGSILNYFHKFFMLFGYEGYLDQVGYSTLSRAKGRLGIYNDVDHFANLYGIKRIKEKYFYESNTTLKDRIIKEIRGER